MCVPGFSYLFKLTNRNLQFLTDAITLAAPLPGT
jgi:hypothetical protein